MKLLLYCTKGKPYLIHESGDYDCNDISCSYDCYSVVDKQYLNDEGIKALNGKIVGECDFEVEEIYHNLIPYHTHSFNQQELLSECCLGVCELDDYLKGKNGYAIHIENLKIFDEPRELNEYKRHNPERDSMWGWLYKAPQNMMYCFDVFQNHYILISIRPEWLRKILNGEKTIEVRKKVLKGMVENGNKH